MMKYVLIGVRFDGKFLYKKNQITEPLEPDF